MAIPIPDNVRPYLALLAKYHFWLLAAVVPLVVLPMVLMAEGDLTKKIKSSQGEIDGKLSSLKSVQGTSPHPNEAWAETIRKDTIRVKRDTLAAWQRFYESQQPLRVWPESLGPDFLDRIGRLQPGGKLARSLLERYHDGVRTIVRTLPKRMGAEELMRDVSGGMDAPEIRGRPMAKPAAGMAAPLVRWSGEDQKRVYASFDWLKAPSTTQVVLAQEEIWMYQILCDAVAAMNAKASGSYDAAIPLVEELAVGFPAAEDKPGGVGEARVFRPAKAAGGMADMPPEGMPDGGAAMEAGDGKPVGRPGHPRFSGAAAAQPVSFAPAAELGGEFGGVPAASPDDALRNWIYVGFDGKPLMAADLSASVANRMIHLMPFRLRVVMDQRRLDELLVRLAAAPVPIDVRQVRVNPGAGGGRPGAGGPGSFEGVGGNPGDSSGGRRPYDVTVELRGTMALATPPDRKALFESEADAEDQPAPAAAAPEAAEDPPAPVQPAAEPPAQPAAEPPAEPAAPDAAPPPADDLPEAAPNPVAAPPAAAAGGPSE